MHRNPVTAGGGRIKWIYSSYSLLVSSSTHQINLDTSRAHRIVAINYATANGTSTTPDSVVMDRFSPSVTGGTYTSVFGMTYSDNSGTEGTGLVVEVFDVSAGSSVFQVQGQTAEDYYGSMVLVFYDSGAVDPLEVKSFTSSRDDQLDYNYDANYTTTKFWGINESDTLALQEQNVAEVTVTGLPSLASTMIVLYHGYGNNYSPKSTDIEHGNSNEGFCILRRIAGQTNTKVTPVLKMKVDGTNPEGQGTSSWAGFNVYDGTKFNALSDLYLSTNTAFSQGDILGALTF